MALWKYWVMCLSNTPRKLSGRETIECKNVNIGKAYIVLGHVENQRNIQSSPKINVPPIPSILLRVFAMSLCLFAMDIVRFGIVCIGSPLGACGV